MTEDEASKLARELRDTCRFHAPDQACAVRQLCDHILSGDMKREIENAAYERAAQWCEREDIERDPDDLYSGRKHRAAAIRALIQPPAQQPDTALKAREAGQ